MGPVLILVSGSAPDPGPVLSHNPLINACSILTFAPAQAITTASPALPPRSRLPLTLLMTSFYKYIT
jgi:hypothetical protein